MKIKQIVFYLLAFILGGCIPSLHPLYTPETLIFDEKLIGKWKNGDELWQFVQAGEKEYEMRFLKDEKEGRFKAHLLQLNEKMFLDLFPSSNDSLENINELYKTHLIPAHMFMMVGQIDPNLQLAWINIGELLNKDPNLLKHEKLDDDKIVLTASTKDLQKFIVERIEANDVNKIITDMQLFTRLEPLFDENDIVFEEKLIGQWESSDGQLLDSIQWNNNGYDMILTDSKNMAHSCKALTVKIKNVMLLAIYFSEPSDNDKKAGLHLIPDKFMIIDQIEPKLLVRDIDYEEVYRIAKDYPLTSEQKSSSNSYLFEGIRVTSK